MSAADRIEAPLLPCPFCGDPGGFDEERTPSQSISGETAIRIKCQNCGARGPWVYGQQVETARTEWNRRAIAAELRGAPALEQTWADKHTIVVDHYNKACAEVERLEALALTEAGWKALNILLDYIENMDTGRTTDPGHCDACKEDHEAQQAAALLRALRTERTPS